MGVPACDPPHGHRPPFLRRTAAIPARWRAASPAAAAVRLRARGSIARRGALPPESCIDPDEMFAELEARGVRFDVTHAPAERTDALTSKVSR